MRPIVGPILLLVACSIEPAEQFGELEQRVGAVEGAIEGEQTCDCSLTEVDRDALKAEIAAEVLASLGLTAGTAVATADDLAALDVRVGSLEAAGLDTATDARLVEIERFASPYLDGASTVAALVGDLDGRLGAAEGELATTGLRVTTVEEFLVGHLGVGETIDDAFVSTSEGFDYVTVDTFVASLSAFADAGDFADLEGRVTTAETDLLALDATLDVAVADGLALASDVATLGADSATLRADVDALRVDVDAQGVDHDALDARVAFIESDYVTAGDVAGEVDLSAYVTQVDLAVTLDAYVLDTEMQAAVDPLALNADLLLVTFGLGDIQDRVTFIESDYTTASGLSAALVPFATDSDLAVLDGRIDTIEAGYVTDADLAGLVSDSEFSAVEAQVSNIDSRVDVIEADYITLAELSTTLIPFATDVDVAGLDVRIDAIEADYVTSLELVPYALDADLTPLSGALASQDNRLDNIEADYITLSELNTTLVPFATDLDVSAIDVRLDTIEADYLTSADLVDVALVDDLDGVTDELVDLDLRLTTVEGDYLQAADLNPINSAVLGLDGRLDVVEADYITLAELSTTLVPFATDVDVAGIDTRVDTIEADYVTAADLSIYALDSDLTGITGSLTSIDARVDVIEADYITLPELSTTLVPFATDVDVAGIDTRVDAIEADYTTSLELVPFALDTDLTPLNSALVGLDGRIDVIEADFITLAELTTTLVPFATDLDVSAIDVRVDAIEADYLTSADTLAFVSDVELDALSTEVADLDLRLTGIEGDYVTTGDLTIYALDTDLTPLNTGLVGLDARVDVIEADYITLPELSTTLVPFATDIDVAGLDVRIDAIEFDYTTSLELVPFALDTDLTPLSGALVSLDGRLDTIEADFTTSVELSTALIPFATDGDVALLDGRIDTIEANYVDAADLASIEGAVLTLDDRVVDIEADYLTSADLVGLATVAELGDVIDLASYLAVDDVSDAVRFVGANVFVQSGTGSTASVDGTGNLVLGFGEGAVLVGSHNLVAGTSLVADSFGALLTGDANESGAPFASVLGLSATTNAVSGTTALAAP